MAISTQFKVKRNCLLEVIEVGCRFDSGGAGTQYSVPDEINRANQMTYSVSLPVNTKWFSMNSFMLT
jgi:hypothetical protein